MSEIDKIMQFLSIQSTVFPNTVLQLNSILRINNINNNLTK